MGRGRLIALTLAAALAAAAGCGPTPPQAPGPQAHRLNTSLSAISTACGHAAEIQAFSNDRRALTIIERQAEQEIPQLVGIWRQNPDWIFQGQSVAELIQMSISFLDECGLHQAAQRLRVATSRK